MRRRSSSSRRAPPRDCRRPCREPLRDTRDRALRSRRRGRSARARRSTAPQPLSSPWDLPSLGVEASYIALRARDQPTLRSTLGALRRQSCALRLRRRPLERSDVDLLHLEHRGHHTLRLLAVGVAEQLGQALRDDLPREAEPVLEPAARALFAALRQLAPVRVDLFLALAADLERDRLVEREVRAAVERDELLPVELELDCHHGALWAWPGRAVTGNAGDLRVRDHRGVELRGVFAFGVEPQARSDLLHGFVLSPDVGLCVSGGRRRRRRELIAMTFEPSWRPRITNAARPACPPPAAREGSRRRTVRRPARRRRSRRGRRPVTRTLQPRVPPCVRRVAARIPADATPRGRRG